jgi:Holliday junction resolvasome RuvABC endonuclease subunit
MTRILGLDLSLTATGVAWEGGTEVLSFPKLRGFDRIERINSAIWEHFGPGKPSEHETVVVIEGYSFGSIGRAVYDIAELGGVTRYLFHERGLRYVEVPPATLKKFATGKGNAGKDEVLAAAIRRFGFAGSNNNEADAWMLFQMGRAAYCSPPIVPTDYQREALAKIEWPEL